MAKRPKMRKWKRPKSWTGPNHKLTSTEKIRVYMQRLREVLPYNWQAITMNLDGHVRLRVVDPGGGENAFAMDWLDKLNTRQKIKDAAQELGVALAWKSKARWEGIVEKAKRVSRNEASRASRARPAGPEAAAMGVVHS